MRTRLAIGVLAGTAAAAVFAGIDGTAIVLAVGGFSLSPGQTIASVVIYTLSGAVLGGIAGMVWSLVRRGHPRNVVASFEWMTVVFTFLSLTLFCWLYLYDYGLGKSPKGHLWQYAAAVPVSLVFAVCTWLLVRVLLRVYRRASSPVVLATLSLVVAVFLEILAVRLVRPGFMAAERPPGQAATAAPNIVLLVMDTTRLDAVSCYGNPRNTTPNLDRLAAEGLVFTRAYAPSPWTPPSHASMFTGLYPSDHGTVSNQTALRGDHTTVAGALSKAGYETFFLSYKGVLRKAFGWDRGFDHSVTVNIEDKASPLFKRLFDKIANKNASPTPLTVDIALAWLDARESTRPFFLFVNVTDPHSPYHAREPFFSECSGAIDRSEVDREKVRKLASKQHNLRLYNKGKIEPLNASEFDYIRCLYDSEARYQDEHLGRLFDRLEQTSGARRTVAIITADHGELLGEHRLMGHTDYLYDELTRVPLIIWGTGASGVADQKVSLIDVFPTILELGRAKVGGDVAPDAVNLLGPPRDRLIFAESWTSGVVRRAVVGEKHKYIWESNGDSLLYDVVLDPNESEDLSGTATDVVRELHGEIAAKFDLSIEKPTSDVVDERSLKILKSLGYVQ